MAPVMSITKPRLPASCLTTRLVTALHGAAACRTVEGQEAEVGTGSTASLSQWLTGRLNRFSVWKCAIRHTPP